MTSSSSLFTKKMPGMEHLETIDYSRPSKISNASFPTITGVDSTFLTVQMPN